ncbi:ZN239 protein, partial [Hydrobates tethys]|nr:ZN239 protein [Oceanodroma tethys]
RRHSGHRGRLAEVPAGWASRPVAVVSPSLAGSRWCYPCAERGKSFTGRSSLSQHRRIQAGEQPHQCGDCGKQFLQRSDLAIRRCRHAGEQPYGCPKCRRRFGVSSSLAK